jgi:hypothetical protein
MSPFGENCQERLTSCTARLVAPPPNGTASTWAVSFDLPSSLRCAK